MMGSLKRTQVQLCYGFIRFVSLHVARKTIIFFWLQFFFPSFSRVLPRLHTMLSSDSG